MHHQITWSPTSLGKDTAFSSTTSSQLCDPTGTHQEKLLLLQAGPVLVLSLLPSPGAAGRVLAPSQGTGAAQDRGTLLLLSLQWAVWEGGREDGACGCHPFLGVKIPLAVEHSDCYELQLICILSVCMRYELCIFIEVRVIKSLC